MKIAIITIHNIHNFGSIFQAYALQKYLLDQKYNVEILDYNPKYFRKNSLKTNIANLIYFREYHKRKKKYKIFIKNNMKLSESKFLNIKDLRKKAQKYDIYIAGGDQLWNTYHPSGRDEAFRLVFTNKKKISYGTSMGRKNFNKEELQELADRLKEFEAISVREYSSVNLLNLVNINNVKHVVDPVLLLEQEEYAKFIKPTNIKEKYLFVYLVDKGELLDKTVEFIATKLNLKIVLFAGMKKKCKCDYFIKDLGPDEVLGFLENAEFVISASFHATVFSVLFKKKFVTLLPGENTNERIEDFLNWSKLKDRIIKEENDLQLKIFETPNFKESEKEIENKKQVSKEFLKENLK